MNIKDISRYLPTITCKDPLSQFLGSFDGGVIEYDFEYIAKLTGHACPTVLTTYLSAVAVAKALYGDDMPVRGDIEILLKDAKDNATTGVSALVFSAIFGAGDEGGFKGIGGEFVRNNRCKFEADISSFALFSRLDTGECVYLDFDFSGMQSLPMPNAGIALQKFLKGENISEFQEGWLNKLKIIAKDFDALGILKLKSSSKI